MNTRTGFWALMSATLASGLIMSGTAMAAPILCSDPTINHMSMDDSQASACLDSGYGNIQGDGPNDDFLNGVGTDYAFIEKSENASNPTSLYSLEYTDDGDGTGTWQFDSSLWASYSTIALGFKFGQGAGADSWFVYELVSGVDSGDWTYLSSKVQGLSHVNLYGKNTVRVPEPGTLALLGIGIVGLTLARRKRHTS